uniref:Uncharacterized protein n=1 Tax=Arundo donax TaxID=35708 RepID=A0A0A9CAQ4_ARUDO
MVSSPCLCHYTTNDIHKILCHVLLIVLIELLCITIH